MPHEMVTGSNLVLLIGGISLQKVFRRPWHILKLYLKVRSESEIEILQVSVLIASDGVYLPDIFSATDTTLRHGQAQRRSCPPLFSWKRSREFYEVMRFNL